MKCSLLTLSCALDGELPRERQAELDAHLITCERCKTGMRYLREETERISQLAAVGLSEGVASALLERARVLTAPGSASADEPAAPAQSAAPPVPDPFGVMGLGAAILEEPAPAAGPAEPGSRPESTNGVVQGPAADLQTPPVGEPVPDTESEVTWESLAAAHVDTPTAAPAPGDAPEPTLDWEAGAADDTPGDPPDAWDAPAIGSAHPPPVEPTPTPGVEEGNETIEPPALAGGDQAPEPAWPEPAQLTPTELEPGGLSQSDAWITGGPGDSEEPAPLDGGAPTDYGAATAGATQAALDTERAGAGASAPAARPDSVEVPGWEPATELQVPWADIPAAQPPQGSVPDLSGVPVDRRTPLPPEPPLPAAPPTRPAAAAFSGIQVDERPPSGPQTPQRASGSGGQRPTRPGGGSASTEPRSWTRTGLIAVAAAALVLIGYNVFHGSGQPASGHHPGGQPSPSASARPSPSSSTTPRATPTPLALTGGQTIGAGGSGYRVETVRYGVHGSQFWVVFQLYQGSGQPTVTTGFDGPQTLYIEMAGVAPGTAVPQPAPGNLVTGISIGHVSGFSGAVYILHLSRAASESPSFLAGNDNGGAGERLVNILQ
ncbi:MAG: zf-HC2 domain-containing protein [Candidatus Dormibacteria bacterium]